MPPVRWWMFKARLSKATGQASDPGSFADHRPHPSRRARRVGDDDSQVGRASVAVDADDEGVGAGGEIEVDRLPRRKLVAVDPGRQAVGRVQSQRDGPGGADRDAEADEGRPGPVVMAVRLGSSSRGKAPETSSGTDRQVKRGSPATAGPRPTRRIASPARAVGDHHLPVPGDQLGARRRRGRARRGQRGRRASRAIPAASAARPGRRASASRRGRARRWRRSGWGSPPLRRRGGRGCRRPSRMGMPLRMRPSLGGDDGGVIPFLDRLVRGSAGTRRGSRPGRWRRCSRAPGPTLPPAPAMAWHLTH